MVQSGVDALMYYSYAQQCKGWHGLSKLGLGPCDAHHMHPAWPSRPTYAFAVQ